MLHHAGLELSAKMYNRVNALEEQLLTKCNCCNPVGWPLPQCALT